MEIETYFNSEHHDPIVELICDGRVAVVGYLSHDNDPSIHPLKDFDGQGRIYGRGRYAMERDDEGNVRQALGLNGDWEPDLDHSEVESRFEEAYLEWLGAQSDEEIREILSILWGCDFNAITDEAVRCNRLDMAEVDGRIHCEFEEAVYDLTEACPEEVDGKQIREYEFVLPVHPLLKSRMECWEEARAAGEIGDVDAVVLDVYEHGGVAWSVSGEGMQCRWDTSSGAGVWVPDTCARDEILRRALVYDYVRIVERGYRTKARYGVIAPDGSEVCEKESWAVAFDAATTVRNACAQAGEKPVRNGRAAAAEELARSAVEEYNKWLVGDVWGVCFEAYLVDGDGEQGEMIYGDACWGFIGNEYAEEERDSGLAVAIMEATNAFNRQLNPVSEVGV